MLPYALLAFVVLALAFILVTDGKRMASHVPFTTDIPTRPSLRVMCPCDGAPLPRDARMRQIGGPVTPQKIVFDVDTGIDDSLALLYLLASPDEAEILAITCTSGNVPARQVALNNLNWLALCDAPEIEVALGSEVPLLAPLMTTEETHGPQGIGYAELPDSGRAISPRHATEVWIDAVRSHPGEVIGLVTGPLTNLALAVRLEPELPRMLKRLVVMGGAFDYKGNTTPVSEWNIAVDPDAAKLVFDAFSGLPEEQFPIIAGLNVTERIEMHPHHLVELAVAAGSEPADEVISPAIPRGPSRRRPTRWCATSPTRSGSTWSSTSRMTRGTSPTSTIRSRPRSPSIRSSRPTGSRPSTSSLAAP